MASIFLTIMICVCAVLIEKLDHKTQGNIKIRDAIIGIMLLGSFLLIFANTKG